MTTLFLVQFALPLVLICWIALAPPRTLFGFCIQVIATAAALWAMALLGIWLLPPWWAPPAFGVALAAATGVGLRRRRPFVSAVPVTWGGWIALGLFVALGVASAYGIVIYGVRVLAPCAGWCLSWTACPTCRCPRWTETTSRATM